MINDERRNQGRPTVLLIFGSQYVVGVPRWQAFCDNRWTASKLDFARHHPNHSVSTLGSQRRGGAHRGVDPPFIRTCTFSFNFLLRSPELKGAEKYWNHCSLVLLLCSCECGTSLAGGDISTNWICIGCRGELLFHTRKVSRKRIAIHLHLSKRPCTVL